MRLHLDAPEMSFPVPIPDAVPIAHPALTISRHTVSGADVFAVETHHSPGRRRRWFHDRSLAIAAALNIAERLELPVLDLSQEASE